MKNSPDTLRKRNQQRAYWKATIDPRSIPKFKLKRCKVCDLEKLCRWNSSFTQTGSPEYKTKCDECFLLDLRASRKQNRKTVSASVTKQRRNRKNKCIDLLGGKCIKCGYCKSTRALTFHHLDPSKKIADISKMISLNSWKSVVQELEKCILLCFNCHMEEEEKNESQRSSSQA